MMDEEIKAFIKREREEWSAFMEAFTKKDPDLCIENKSCQLWSEGLEKYGMKWSEREYELRNDVLLLNKRSI